MFPALQTLRLLGFLPRHDGLPFPLSSGGSSRPCDRRAAACSSRACEWTSKCRPSSSSLPFSFLPLALRPAQSARRRAATEVSLHLHPATSLASPQRGELAELKHLLRVALLLMDRAHPHEAATLLPIAFRLGPQRAVALRHHVLSTRSGSGTCCAERGGRHACGSDPRRPSSRWRRSRCSCDGSTSPPCRDGTCDRPSET